MAFRDRLIAPIKAVPEFLRSGKKAQRYEYEFRALQESIARVLESVSTQNAATQETRRQQAVLERRLLVIEARIGDLAEQLRPIETREKSG